MGQRFRIVGGELEFVITKLTRDEVVFHAPAFDPSPFARRLPRRSFYKGRQQRRIQWLKPR